MNGNTAHTADEARIWSLDVLRGWAVFGMLIVNLGYFSRHPLLPPEGSDVVSAMLIQFLAVDTFWTLFSVLFGYGFVLHCDRATELGRSFVSPYSRRLLVLGLLGVLHSLLHPSEVLHRYALLGFLLMALRRASPATLVVVGTASLVTTIVLPGQGGRVDPMLAAEVFSNGSLGEVVAFNATRFWSGVWDTRLLEPLPYLLVGVLLGRRRALVDADFLPRIRRSRVWMCGAGVVLQFSLVLMMLADSAASRRILIGLVSGLSGLGSGLLGLFYASVIVLCAEGGRGEPVLRVLAAVGRLALTNYLLQTVVVTTLLYGYGLGLYGHIGITTGVLLALVLFILQGVWSVWWVRRFRHGPAEWAWRSLARGRVLPLTI